MLVLGGLIVAGVEHRQQLCDVVAQLAPADFYLPKHSAIFEAVASVAERTSGNVDASLVRAELNERGQLHEVGGVDYLIELAESVPTVEHLRHYVPIVRRLAGRRSALNWLGEAVRAVHESDDIETVRQHAKAAASSVEAVGAGDVDAVRLSDVMPEPIRWLWPDRIARGKLSVLAGDPGAGKSFLTIDMAARVSSGAGWPDRPGDQTDPGGVVLLSAEDDVADTIRPRLDAAGADCSRIEALRGTVTTDRTTGAHVRRGVTLDRDLPAIERAIERIEDCALLVIDPITAYCGSADSHNNAEVRGLLAPLSEIAARHNVAVVAVSHLNKSGGGNAIYRVQGSLAFAAAARSAWLVQRDESDPDRRLLLRAKSNVGADVDGLAYSLRPAGMDGTPQIHWEAEPVQMTADDSLQPPREPTAVDEAAAWLRDRLADGPVAPSTLLSDSPHAERTLRRAKTAIGARSEQQYDHEKGRVAGWVWTLEPPA